MQGFLAGPRFAALIYAAPMKLWHAALVVVLLVGLLRLVPEPGVLTADEVDTLSGGFQLADRLTDSDVGLKRRLVEGFITPAGHPRLAALPDTPWRPPTAEAPLPRWLAALGLMGPDLGESSNLGRASRGATVAFALALALLLAVWWREEPGLAIVSVVVLLAMPTALQSAASSGAAAAGIAAMACWLAAMRLATGGGRVGWPVGIACGLCLAVHPGASVLLISVFVAWAVARRTQGDAAADGGEAPLPSAPVGLYLAPILAVATLVLLWPSLWTQTGARLGAWLLESFQIAAPSQSVVGHAFEQSVSRAPQAWTALAQWGAWCTWPVIIAWGLGVRDAWVAGRTAAWTPIIATISLLFVASIDGGLFNARLSLLPMIWVSTALTAGVGIISLGRRLAAWRGWRPVAGVVACGALALGLALAGTLTGSPAPSASRLGAAARAPVPLAMLRAIEQETPGAAVHLSPTPDRWRDAVNVARDHLGIDVTWAASHADAAWHGHADRAGAAGARAPDAPTFWRGHAFGLPWTVDRSSTVHSP